MRFLISLILICFIAATAQSQYRIEGELAGYDQSEIYLGYYYADKQYLMDTSQVEKGKLVFEGSDTLKPGVYIVVMPPDNSYFQLMVNEGNPNFSFAGEKDRLEQTLKFDNSPDNQLFYENLAFIGEQRKIVEELRQKMEITEDEQVKTALEEKLEAINLEVTSFQKELVAKNPDGLTATLVRSGFNIELPKFEGTEEEVQRQRYIYYKKHYFDNIDLSDDRLLRTPQHVFFDRVYHYIEKLTPQHPDSIIVSLDYILGKMEPAQEAYRYFLIEFLNKYAQSKIVGMDAVYVHLALQYYGNGKAPWVDESQLKKIISNAEDASPTLIGKVAPNFVVQQKDGSNISLAEVKALYIVLVFWAHDCSHCQTSMPELVEFHKNFQESDSGIQVFSVCTKLNSDEPPCWDFVTEKNLEGLPDWINASDQLGGRSYMHSLYNIKKTPKMFVLDGEKRIITKDLSVEQLYEFFEQTLDSPTKG